METTKLDLDCYELAYLSGIQGRYGATSGNERLAAIIIVNLIERKFLQWNVEAQKLEQLEMNHGDLTKLERPALLIAIRDNFTIDDLGSTVVGIGWSIAERIRFHGLPIEKMYYLGLLSPILGICIPAYGAVKLGFSSPAVWVIVVLCFILTHQIENVISSPYKKDRKVVHNFLTLTKQKIPSATNPLEDNLSKAYALHGDIVLADIKYKGLSDILKPQKQGTFDACGGG